MGNLLKPQNVKIITKEGECVVAISLDLNINLNGNNVEVVEAKKQEVEPSFEWAIPEFKSEEKIKFGKKEK